MGDISDALTLGNARERVKTALELTRKWRDIAREDYEFIQGRQWSKADIDNMRKASRAPITINRCRPIINLICGYAAQNETEPDFLPRSEEDDSISRVAKGITKYALDRTNYQLVKGAVFRDAVSCGAGYYWTSYAFDYDKMDGTIKIERVSPFEVFVDPEGVALDLSDADFCGRYSWETPERLAQVYQDKADEIATLTHKLDESEQYTDSKLDTTWYSHDLKKVRVVQYWYKKYTTRKVFVLGGAIVEPEQVEQLKTDARAYLQFLAGAQEQEIPETQIRYMTFADNILLEEGESPYKHKRFPIVRQLCYYTGENIDGDYLEPAGIIRDIKDAQRELNKNRSQRMHIVNQQALGVRFWYGTADEKTRKSIKTRSTTPGADIFLPPGVTFQDGAPSAQSLGNIELENQASNDFYSISGITPESLSGSVGAMSGKAIDLRQSVTTVQTADIFSKAKDAERQLVQLLWGEKGRPGLIPQYYNKDKALRILGEDGKKEFVQINPGQGQAAIKQPVTNMLGQQQTDEDGNPVYKVLYDLSAFDFDIVITTSSASATARRANLYQLLEAKKSGVDIPMDIILDFMDFPEKETVKKRMHDAAKMPKMPEFKVSGRLDDLPAEALSMALQSIGVNISPQEIMAERLALKGRDIQAMPQQGMQGVPPQGMPGMQGAPPQGMQPPQGIQGMPPEIPQQLNQ